MSYVMLSIKDCMSGLFSSGDGVRRLELAGGLADGWTADRAEDGG